MSGAAAPANVVGAFLTIEQRKVSQSSRKYKIEDDDCDERDSKSDCYEGDITG